jgi:hypothetical protein
MRIGRLSRLLIWLLGAIFIAIQSASASLAGFLTFPGDNGDSSKPRVTGFSDIYWQSKTGGLITTISGSTTPFNKAELLQIIYLDDSYYTSINDNPSFKPFRTDVIDREIVIPSVRTDITSDSDIRPFITGSAALASIMNAAPEYSAVLTPIKQSLDGEITHYQSGDRKVNNQGSIRKYSKRLQRAPRHKRMRT